MAIFSKKDSFQQESEKAEKEVISSIIDSRMTIKGELLFEGKARVDGTVIGNIKGEHLILSESGTINGDVQVTTLVCHGILEGNIKANLVSARKSCQIHGLIASNSLSVEPGAALSGEVKVATKELHLVPENDSIPQESAAT